MAEMPPQAAAPEAPEPQEGGGDPLELLNNVKTGLTMLATLFSQTPGIPDPLKQKMAQINDDFSSVAQALAQAAGGAAPGGAPQTQGAPASVEAGGNPNARPM